MASLSPLQANRALGRPHPGISGIFRPYPIKQIKYSSHYYARKFTGANQDVLDIGCGEGFLAAEMRRDGNRITGVDSLPEVSETSLSRVILAAISIGIAPVVHRLKGSSSTGSLLDVLEHLEVAGAAIARVRGVLNRAAARRLHAQRSQHHGRLMLLLGRFNYSERGILDRTHLRSLLAGRPPPSRKTADTGSSGDTHCDAGRVSARPFAQNIFMRALNAR